MGDVEYWPTDDDDGDDTWKNSNHPEEVGVVAIEKSQQHGKIKIQYIDLYYKLWDLISLCQYILKCADNKCNTR